MLYGLNASLIRNMTASGNCVDYSASYLDISCGVFIIRIASGPLCDLGINSFNWTLKSMYGLPYPGAVVQFGSDAYTLQWNSQNDTTGAVPFSNNPVVGILTSSIAFGNPTANSVSNVTLRVILVTALFAGDCIVLYLPSFVVPSLQFMAVDSRGNTWNAKWSPLSFELCLTASRMYSPFALELTISEDIGFVLPVMGLAPDCRCLFITLRRRSVTLTPQALQRVQSAGAITYSKVVVTAQSKYSAQHTEITPHRAVVFTVNMSLSNPLNIGDQIFVFAPNYTFYRDAIPIMEGDSSSKLIAFSNSSSKTIVLEVVGILSDQIHITINAADAIGVPFISCYELKDFFCPLYITILSVSCPIRNAFVVPTAEYNFPFASISLKNVHYVQLPIATPVTSPTSIIGISKAPTFSPIVSPGSTPSAQPLASPTNGTLPYLLQIDLIFIIQLILPRNTLITVSAPQFITPLTTNQTAVLAGNWTSYWNGSSQSLHLISDSAIYPGTNYIVITSSTLTISDEIIYANDSRIVYSIDTGTFILTNNQFDVVEPAGLSTSSLAFYGFSDFGRSIGISLNISAAVSFAPGDILYVRLPRFNCSYTGLLTIEVLPNATRISAQWNNTLGGVQIVFIDSVDSFQLLIPSSNNITLPYEGCNLITGIPMISLRAGQDFYAATPFQYFTPVANLGSSFLGYSNTAAAGSETPIQVGFNYTLEILPYDTFTIFLPNFWSISEVAVLNSNELFATWSNCNFTLRLMALRPISGAVINVTILGLRLPVDGINVDLGRGCSLTSNATYGNIVTTPFSSVQLVGFFPLSSVTFETPSIGGPSTMIISFIASFTILANETVTLYIPTVVFSSPISTQNVTTFNISWDGIALLSMTVIKRLDAYTLVTLVLNNSVLLPSEGYPPYDPALAPQISCNASEGPTPLSPLTYIESIGVTGSVTYDIGDLGSPVGINIGFQLSSYLSSGDIIEVIAPIVRGNATSPSCVGTLASISFVCYFNISYSVASSTFKLVANQHIPSLYVGVLIGSDNDFYLRANPVTNTHYVSGNISTLGRIGLRVMDHYPTDIIGLNNSATASFDSCNTAHVCSMVVMLNLSEELSALDFLTIGHSSFSFLNLQSNDNVSISGNASSFFSASLRKSDSMKSVQLGDTLESTGPVVTNADIAYHPVNLSLNSTSLPVMVITKVPQIYGVSILGSASSLQCGDNAMISVLFTEPVKVLYPSYIQLKLNTNESAKFLSGNLSSTLTFIYHVMNPISVSVLEVQGANSITLGKSGIILTNDGSGIRVNTTIPEPFSIYEVSQGVSVRCGMNFSNVINVTVYGIPSNVTLATGDVLYVAVNFDRVITVVGNPSLQLLGDANSVYTALYRNVSLIQWISVEGPGDYTLFVGSQDSQCIPWNNTNALQQVLNGFNGLKNSLPVTILSSPYPKGMKYRLMFNGVPPSILGASRVICNYSASAAVSIDPSMQSTAVFQYTIRQGDMASHLSYPNQSSLKVDYSNMIFLSNSARSNAANTQLPYPGDRDSLFGTSNITINTTAPNIERVYSNFNSSIGYAVAGDGIYIWVRFSSPVAVFGYPYISLNVHSALTNITYPIVARYLSSNTYLVQFLYTVHLGEFAHPLDTLPNASVVLNGSRILLRSLQPSTPATTSLPMPGSSDGLYNSHVNVNASSRTNLFSVSCDQPPGVYGAGMLLTLRLTFYDVVFIISMPSQPTPSIILAAPNDAIIRYANGSGSSSISFSYLIEFGQNADPIQFSFSGFSLVLLNGKFSDALGDRWETINLAPHLDLLTGIVVDTSPPYVVRVNSANGDGTYFPGQIVDITVTFNKKVEVFGIPKLEVFAPYENMLNKLAVYVSGNDSYDIHFEYMVPLPDYEFAYHPQVPFDYAGDASLYQNLNGAIILEAHGTTPANVILTAKDHDYLRFNRSLFINFNAPSIVEVRASNPAGVYTGMRCYSCYIDDVILP